MDIIESTSIVSKPLVGYLIDDDELVCTTWELTARSSQRQIKVFSNLHSFVSASPTLNHQTPVYIDYGLLIPLGGLAAVAPLYNLGFTNLTITTGHTILPEPIEPYIKRVIDKMPPWVED
jgi:hypothetical protein